MYSDIELEALREVYHPQLSAYVQRFSGWRWYYGWYGLKKKDVISQSDNLSINTVQERPVWEWPHQVEAKLAIYDARPSLLRWLQRLFTPIEKQRTLLCYRAAEMLLQPVGSVSKGYQQSAYRFLEQQAPKVRSSFLRPVLTQLAEKFRALWQRIVPTIPVAPFTPASETSPPAHDPSIPKQSALFISGESPAMKKLLQYVLSSIQAKCETANRELVETALKFELTLEQRQQDIRAIETACLLLCEGVAERAYSEAVWESPSLDESQQQAWQTSVRQAIEAGRQRLQQGKKVYEEFIQVLEKQPLPPAADYTIEPGVGLAATWTKHERTLQNILQWSKDKLSTTLPAELPTESYVLLRRQVKKLLDQHVYGLIKACYQWQTLKHASKQAELAEAELKEIFQQIDVELDRGIQQLAMVKPEIHAQGNWERTWLEEWKMLLSPPLEVSAEKPAAGQRLVVPKASDSTSKALVSLSRAPSAPAACSISPGVSRAVANSQSSVQPELASLVLVESPAEIKTLAAEKFKAKFKQDLKSLEATGQAVNAQLRQMLVDKASEASMKEYLARENKALEKQYKAFIKNYHPDRATQLCGAEVAQAQFLRLVEAYQGQIQAWTELAQGGLEGALSSGIMEEIMRGQQRIWEGLAKLRQMNIKIEKTLAAISEQQEQLRQQFEELRKKLGKLQENIELNQKQLDENGVAIAELKFGMQENGTKIKEVQYFFNKLNKRGLRPHSGEIAEPVVASEIVKAPPTKAEGHIVDPVPMSEWTQTESVNNSV